MVGSRMADQGSYDLLILDWMPFKTGLEIAVGCDHRQTTPSSSHCQRYLDDRVQGLDAGADDYLVKPFGAGVTSASPRPFASFRC